eukprot:3715822-Pyramimonas_sp.AAC.1
MTLKNSGVTGRCGPSSATRSAARLSLGPWKCMDVITERLSSAPWSSVFRRSIRQFVSRHP